VLDVDRQTTGAGGIGLQHHSLRQKRYSDDRRSVGRAAASLLGRDPLNR